MNNILVQFAQGLERYYLSTTYPDTVYFATDTHKIFLNGVEYSKPKELDEKINNLTKDINTLTTEISEIKESLNQLK